MSVAKKLLILIAIALISMGSVVTAADRMVVGEFFTSTT